MGGHVKGATESPGTTFSPAGGTATSAKTSHGKGYSSKDTIGKSDQQPKESCCVSQTRLSNWFSQASGVKKALFVLASILTGGLFYLGALAFFKFSGSSKE